MVNGVSFAARGIYDKTNLDAPQVHQRPNSPMANHPRYEEPKKSGHKFLKTLAALVATAAVAVGAVAIGSKMGWLKPDKIKSLVPKKLLDAEKLANFKAPVKNGIAAVEKFGNTVADKAISGYNTVYNFAKGLIDKVKAPKTV